MILTDVLNFFLPVSMMVNPYCDYFQSMTMGREYYVYNNEYPDYYSGGTSCRWIAQSPPGTQIVLSCSDVNLPASNNCAQDRLAVSLTGNLSLSDAHNYCGIGSISLISTDNSLVIGLFTARFSSGGRFQCTVVAIRSEQPETTTTARPNNCDCGWRQQRRIVGGVETGVNEFPYMAAIIDLPISNLHCGAVIISRQHALTAAHCLERKQARELALLVGDHDISSGTETSSAALYILDFYQIYEHYNNRTNEHDIALVTTQNFMDFSMDVGPVCLPFRFTDQNFENNFVTILGWGTTDFSDPKSDVLLAANVSIVPNSQCQMSLPLNRIFASQLCTYTPGKDACQFDSGGPLLWYDSSSRRYQVLGLVSYGLACGSQVPAINTRVSSYLSWVIRSTSGITYCVK